MKKTTTMVWVFFGILCSKGLFQTGNFTCLQLLGRSLSCSKEAPRRHRGRFRAKSRSQRNVESSVTNTHSE
jgi:hypothetical protein